MLARISSRELSEWMAFFEIEEEDRLAEEAAKNQQ